MNKKILTQFKTHLSKIGLDAQNVQKRDPARASLRKFLEEREKIKLHIMTFMMNECQLNCLDNYKMLL